MRCVIISKARFVLNEGRPASVVINYDRFWSRYLAVYDEVIVVGMLFEREEPNARPVEGPGVTLVPIRGFRSPAGALRNMRTLSRALDEVYAPDAAFIIRSPNFLGDIMYRKLRRRGHPYGLELAGDPYLTFTPEGGFRPLQLLARWHFTRYARLECRDACAVAYTSAQQQRRYPAGRDTFTTIYSYLTLNDEDIVESPRVYDREAKPLSLVAVGSLQRLYKSPDVVIEALAECVGRG
ncbi:MAG: hypothetical protein J7M38_05315, partial [Armatimonadetes bacterium]|nr:hypothetical protein [Armatimonadota bacterium]